MKKRLLMLLSIFMAITSVGWVQAQTASKAVIKTDLTGAITGKPIVFGVTTLPNGVEEGTKVRVKIELTGDNQAQLEQWDLQYFEPNQAPNDWLTWNKEDGAYVFGPSTGFPFQAATSYFKMTPKTAGTYAYKLTVEKVNGGTVAVESLVPPFVVGAAAPLQGRGIASIGNENYASLGAAVHFAKDNYQINLSEGSFVLTPGTEKIAAGNNESGWYLPITQKGLKVIGKGVGQGGTMIVPELKEFTVNAAYATQNFITIFSDDVTLEGMTILSKKETNKLIQVSGKNVILKNIESTYSPNGDAFTFAGSIYFASEDAGTATLKGILLTNGRITFTGAQKGTIAMKGINIRYDDLSIAPNVIKDNNIQDYCPIGSISGKNDLKITAEEITVHLFESAANAYQLDANTVANLPAGTTLALEKGKYELSSQLVIDKPLTIEGGKGEAPGVTLLKAIGNAWPKDGQIISQKANLISIEGTAAGIVNISNIAIEGSKASGINAQSTMETILNGVSLVGNKNAGLLVHSKVNAFALTTNNNGWGGVNVDKGTPAYTPSFTFDVASTFEEKKAQIWSEITNDEKIVTIPEDAGWKDYIGKGGTGNTTDMRFWTNASSSITAKDAAELKVAIASAIPEQVIELTGTYYELENSLTITQPITLKNNADARANITFANGGFVVAANNVILERLDVKATTGNALCINSGKIGTKVKGGFYMNDVAGKQGEGAIRYEGSNGAINVSGTTLKGGIHVLNYDGGALDGIKDNTISFADGIGTPLAGINVYCATSNSAPKLAAPALLKQQKSIAMPATGAQYDILYQNNDWSVTDGVASPKSSEALAAVVAGKENITIALAAQTYTFSKQLTISKKVTLIGTGTTTVFEAGEPWTGSTNADKYLLTITADDVTLNNLIIQKSQLGGINVFEAKNVKLDNVISKDNAGCGMVVNSSEVTISNFQTSGNKWGYGVNVDKGSQSNQEPVLTIGEGCSFGEPIAVKSDKSDAPNSYVVGSGWVQMKKKEGNKEVMVWANAASSGINFAITSVPSEVVYGQANLPLIANVENATIAIQGATDVVEIKSKGADDGTIDSLIIKKPGDAVLTITVNDTIATQTLTVLKKTLTVTGITATNKEYNGGTDVTLVTTGMEVKGLVGDDTKDADAVLDTPTGVLASANAGDAVPVDVTATFKSGKTDYYDLAPITGVTDTVKKVALTVTASKPTAVDYGKVDPTLFAAATTGWVNNEAAANLSGKLQFDCPATKSSLAGKYPVMPYGYTSQNYAISYIADSLEVKAIAPTVELVSATIGADKTSATVKGRVISNGGTKTTDLKGDFTVGSTAKSLSLAVDKDGNFETTLTGLASQQQSIAAVAAKGGLTGTSAAMNVDLSLNLQNVAFVSELSRLVYGSEATVGAKGFAEGAEVEFTSSDASVLSIGDSIQVKANKAGTATITVTATLKGYITAIAKQTVTVEPKALTVAVGSLNKTYDGTTAVTPTYTLNGVIEADKSKVNVVSKDVTANYLDKNASTANKTVVLSGALTLSGTVAGNYSLTQPSNLKGTIAKAGEVTVTATDVTRKYNEKALRYNLSVSGLVDGETLTTPNLYTGVIAVSESGTDAVVSLNGVSFANYSSVKATNGTITVVKGTPRVLTLSGATAADAVTGLVIDNEGWEVGTIEIKEDGDSKFYAQVTYGNGQIARGASIEQKAAPVIKEAAWEWQEMTTKALSLRAASTSKTMTYGSASTFAEMEGFTFATSTSAVITLSDAGGKKRVNAVGVGTAAVLATNSEGGVTYLEVTVNPAQLTAEASGLNKVYDGSNLANAQVTLSKDNSDGVYIDLAGVQFTYASKDVANGIVINPSKPLVLTGNKAANYTIDKLELKGEITVRDLTVSGPISKYYDGSKTEVLTSYSAAGLISGEEVPVTATFSDASAGTNKAVTLTTASKNYKLLTDVSVKTGSIVQSTIDVILNDKASAGTANAVIKELTVRETGKKVSVSAISLTPVIKTEGSGTSTVYYVSGGDTENYTVVYASNQIGFKSEGGGGDNPGSSDVAVTGVSLDVTTKTLQRTQSFTLTATVTPTGATNKGVKWSSSDPTIASVDAAGKVTAVKVGEATITVTTDDGAFTATCVVTVDFATSLEEAIAATRVYSNNGMIRIEPQMPMDVMVVNMVGQVIYNGHIAGASQIAVSASGIYIVRLGTGNAAKVHKVNVK